MPPTPPLMSETLPAGAYWSGVIRRGRTLRLVDLEATGGVALVLHNAHETSERYNAPDTVKIQNQIFMTTGMALFSDLGRIMCSIVEDTSGHHDTLGGASDALSLAHLEGDGSYLVRRNGRSVNTHDNLVAALGRHGLDRRDIVPTFNVFDRVEVIDGGEFSWIGPNPSPARSIALRAEMDLLATISNTPHALDPAPVWQTGPLLIEVHGNYPTSVDPRIDASDELRRGFENTDQYVALLGH